MKTYSYGRYLEQVPLNTQFCQTRTALRGNQELRQGLGLCCQNIQVQYLGMVDEESPTLDQ
jgi:hypothetical protein